MKPSLHGETDPHVADTDGDRMTDGREREVGTDPPHVDGRGTDPGVFVNFTFFCAPHPRVVVGSEQNFEWFPNLCLVRG